MTEEKHVDVESSKDDSPIIFYTFEYLSNSARFRTLLEERFMSTGHTRKIEFRHWDCYHEIPDTDGDIYAYDACAMSALVDKGILRYGSDFYEEFDLLKAYLLSVVQNMEDV